MRARSFCGLLAGLILLLAPAASNGQILGLEQVASGLTAPIFATHAPGDHSRLFIVERGGAIKILNLGTGMLEASPFLSIAGVDTAGEGGLLGLAFHPDYQTNGRFYVNVTIDNGGDTSLGVTSPFSTHIREYMVSGNPNFANGRSEREILSFVQPQSNHNGGWIGFSPNDGLLYIATGDGGGGGDDDGGHTPGTGNAQDIEDNLLGKMLRIDPLGDDFDTDDDRNYAIPPSNPFVGVTGDDEIWAYGLRNPFRASFDRQTGDLWIGDVGQSAREEIDFQPGTSTGGENYGWRIREGLIGGTRPPGNVDPVYDYNRDEDQFGGTVVSGGYVYRGPDPAIQGQYFFLDSRNSVDPTDDNYWMFDPADPFDSVENIDSLLGIPTTSTAVTHRFPVSFGEDAAGNLYIAYIGSGEVYRIATVVIPEPATMLLAIASSASILVLSGRRRLQTART